MNIVLFEIGEWARPLDRTDVRAVHLQEILMLTPGDRFAAGEIGAGVGTLEWTGMGPGGLTFGNPEWTTSPPLPSRVKMVIGTPRPPTARRLMKDLTTAGVAELHFIATDLGDKSYLQSTLWNGEFRRWLIEGAAQARTTWLPEVHRHARLESVLGLAPEASRIWFDEGGLAWTNHGVHDHPVGDLWLALGPERGWSARERALLADRGWDRAGLGPRTLRTETACSLALGIAVLKGWA